MAKIIKGGRSYKGKDKTMSYGTYTSSGRMIRRAINPEFYMHSWSREVKRNREIFAKVMENYSKMDIVTKQAYTEVPFLNPPLPITPWVRKKLNDLWQRAKNKPKWGAWPFPFPFPWPEGWPWPWGVPNPSISQYRWPYSDYEPWPKQRGVGGHNQAVRDGIAENWPRRDWNNPYPPEVPLPGPTPNERKNPGRQPVYIVIEVDPEELEGKNWDLELYVYSQYTRVRRWISSHKKEIIIIVAVGAIITLGYSLMVGGVSIASGTEILVTPVGEAMLGGLAIMIPNAVIKHIQNWYHKRLLIKAAEKENIWAWNNTKSWYCYKEVWHEENRVIHMFYEGPDKKYKGKTAAIVELEIDWETETATMTWICGETEDEIWLYDNNLLLQVCNPTGMPVTPVTAFNLSKNVWCEARKEKIGNAVKLSFEDRPAFGDGDYNDIYAWLFYDAQGNLTDVRIIEGMHFDRIAVYFMFQLVEIF